MLTNNLSKHLLIAASTLFSCTSVLFSSTYAVDSFMGYQTSSNTASIKGPSDKQGEDVEGKRKDSTVSIYEGIAHKLNPEQELKSPTNQPISYPKTYKYYQNAAKRNPKNAFSVYKEAAIQGMKEAQDELIKCCDDIAQGRNGIERNLPMAIIRYKEILILFPEKENNRHTLIQNKLSSTLNNYASILGAGTNGVTRNLPMAIKLYKEALTVCPDKTNESYRAIQKNLTMAENRYINESYAANKYAAESRVTTTAPAYSNSYADNSYVSTTAA